MSIIAQSGSFIKITFSQDEIMLIPASDIRVDLLDGKIAILANNDRVLFDVYDSITSPAGSSAVLKYTAIEAIIAAAASGSALTEVAGNIIAATSTSTGSITANTCLWLEITNVGDATGTITVDSGTITLQPGDRYYDERKAVGPNMYLQSGVSYVATGTTFKIIKKLL